MRILRHAALLLGTCSAALAAHAQTTTITATVPNYANGTAVATFIPQGGGAPAHTHASTHISNTGSFSILAWDNTNSAYAPSSATQVQICGPSPYASTCYSVNTVISGTTEDISSLFSAAPNPNPNTVAVGGNNGDIQYNANGSLGGLSVVPVANGGTGTTTPGLQAGANIASITGAWPNQAINAAVQTSTPQYTAPQPISGCGVAYISGLTYTVGACTYTINSVTYTSPLTNITLPAADATNPEIDVIYVDTTGTVNYVQGAPAVTPQAPTVDPSTQLELTFVLVPANGTAPSNTQVTSIYLENTEWTGATGGTSAANVNLASTNNPYAGTKDIEFGNGGTVASTTYAQFTKPASGTENLTNYNALVFYIRNKAAWATGRSVTIQWYNGSTPVGNAVVFSNGSYGFSSSNTSSYQQISIPASTFATSSNAVTTLRFTVSGSGTALTGFYVDQITLQAGNGGVTLPSTLMNYKGTYSSSATYQPNDTVSSGSLTYIALQTNTNVAVTNTATWKVLNSIPGSVGVIIDGGGIAPTTGAKGFIQVPYAGTITSWTLIGDASGSAQITVSKGTYANFPTVSSIVASAPPSLSSAQKNTSTTLTGWTTTVSAGDILTFNLDSVSTVTRLMLELQIARN